MTMLIEVDISVLEEAKKGRELALEVLDTLAFAQRRGFHALWAAIDVLDGIVKLPIKYPEVYCSIKKKYTYRHKLLERVSMHAIVTFAEETHRDKNVKTKYGLQDIIYIKPTWNEGLMSFYKTTLLTENLTDGELFEYIAQWYLRKQTDLTRKVSYSFVNEMSGGNPMAEVYKKFAERQRDCFCLCIADSDIKADVKVLLTNKLINESQIPPYGKTFKNVFDYDCKNDPFNCACYCFENVLEVENLIPMSIIECESNYKHEILAIKSANISDLSYFDFKEGLSQSKIESKPYIKAYWKQIIFKNRTIPELKGFGSMLLSNILKNRKVELSNIDDNMLSSAQLKEYEEIGKRIFGWCCTISCERAGI